jgi:hypothetical protein
LGRHGNQAVLKMSEEFSCHRRNLTARKLRSGDWRITGCGLQAIYTCIDERADMLLPLRTICVRTTAVRGKRTPTSPLQAASGVRPPPRKGRIHNPYLIKRDFDTEDENDRPAGKGSVSEVRSSLIDFARRLRACYKRADSRVEQVRVALRIDTKGSSTFLTANPAPLRREGDCLRTAAAAAKFPIPIRPVVIHPTINIKPQKNDGRFEPSRLNMEECSDSNPCVYEL